MEVNYSSMSVLVFALVIFSASICAVLGVSGLQSNDIHPLVKVGLGCCLGRGAANYHHLGSCSSHLKNKILLTGPDETSFASLHYLVYLHQDTDPSSHVMSVQRHISLHTPGLLLFPCLGWSASRPFRASCCCLGIQSQSDPRMLRASLSHLRRNTPQPSPTSAEPLCELVPP